MGGGGVLGSGIGGESGFLGTGLLGSGPQQLKGFGVNKNLTQAENEMIKRQADIASGKAPSVTELQYKQAMEDALAQQQALAASQRGSSNAGLALRTAMQAGQQTQMGLARESATAKLQEQRAADQMIAQQAASQRGTALQADQTNMQARQQYQQRQAEMIGGLGSSLVGLSDENMKKDIKPSDDSSKVISEFMDALKSYTYEYKNKSKQPDDKPKPEGKVKGVMAQDLEKSELGKQMVTDTKNGKVVDFAQGMAPLFAAIAELNDRTKKLEGK